jgi:hypothetical protein
MMSPQDAATRTICCEYCAEKEPVCSPVEDGICTVCGREHAHAEQSAMLRGEVN